MQYDDLRRIPWLGALFGGALPTATCDALLLQGDGEYLDTMVVTSGQQEWLHSLFAESEGRLVEREFIAELDFDGFAGASRRRVFLKVEDLRIGACPAHIGNQCRDWLNRWKLADAKVYCRIKAICERSHGPPRYYAKIDLVRPFKMTTYVPEIASADLGNR